MTARSTSLHFPEGTKRIGTARVREDARPAMTTAQRLIFEATGNRPNADSGFDEIADGFDPFAPAPLSTAEPEKPPKYRNANCEHDGIQFDSRKEMSRWIELSRELAAGLIRDLERQVVFVLIECQRREDGSLERASKYVADFVYTDAATGKRVVEDVKSSITRRNPTYVLKRKLMLERHGITIKEV